MSRCDPNSRRARTDTFAPPDPPRECECWHCGQRFMSSDMQWGRKEGMWSATPIWWCPTPLCSGAGFGFDVHPVKEASQ